MILGEKGVGKSSFIEHCFVSYLDEEFILWVVGILVLSEFLPAVFVQGLCSGPRLSLHVRALICGREIKIQVVESPGRQQLIPAVIVILLFDLTCKVGVSCCHGYIVCLFH